MFKNSAFFHQKLSEIGFLSPFRLNFPEVHTQKQLTQSEKTTKGASTTASLELKFCRFLLALLYDYQKRSIYF